MRKLTKQAAEEIRQSTKTAKKLATEYGVSKPAIYDILNGHTYGDGTARRGKTGRPAKPVPERRPCECNCGDLAGPGKRFLQGHFQRTPEFLAVCNVSGIKPEPYTAERWLETTFARCVEQDCGYETPCLIWQGPVGTAGYPIGVFETKQTTRHRILYQIVNRVTLPRNLFVDHACNQRRCLNTDHIRAMSPAGNTRRSKLTNMTPEKVAELKMLRDAGWTYKELGDRYDLRANSAYNIYAGYRWKIK